MGFAERLFLCLPRNKRERFCTETIGMIQPTSRQGHLGAPTDEATIGQIAMALFRFTSGGASSEALERLSALEHTVHDDGKLSGHCDRCALEPDLLAQRQPPGSKIAASGDSR